MFMVLKEGVTWGTDTTSRPEASLRKCATNNSLDFFYFHLDPECGLWDSDPRRDALPSFLPTFHFLMVGRCKTGMGCPGKRSAPGQIRGQADGQLSGRFYKKAEGTYKFLSCPLHPLFSFIWKFVFWFCFLDFGSPPLPGCPGAGACDCWCGGGGGGINDTAFLCILSPFS